MEMMKKEKEDEDEDEDDEEREKKKKKKKKRVVTDKILFSKTMVTPCRDLKFVPTSGL